MQKKLVEFYKNQNVLITGGAGFIGSHLCEQLIKLGARVKILDNFATGSLKNLEAISEKIDVIEGSVTHFADCLHACTKTDIVFHLAAVVSVGESQNKPQSCLETNVTGTQNMLEAARLKDGKRFIFASSAAVYGNYEGICSENIPPQPVSTYGYSKWLSEQLCQLFAKAYAFETVCLRYFNVYGPRQNPDAGNGGVLAVLHHKIAHNQPIMIYGDGSQTRDFVHVDHIVLANLQAAMLTKKCADGQAFNIATGQSISLNQKLQELLLHYPDYNGPISYTSPRAGDIKYSQADCSKFKNALL